MANGITVNYSYDDASQLIAITYQKPDNSVIGDLSYSYDAAGRRIATGGSFARTTLPDDMPGASFDATNRLTALGPQSLSYDANGNLISDGNQSYIWNARNQLVQIKSNAGTVIANFSYDALGRRQTKSIGGIDTGYVYDGINVVQELNAANVDNSLPVNVRASYISGGVDEVFAQLMGSGASASINSYLSDVQGSTLRLADATGNKVVDYTYDPYGNTTADAIVNNPFQYTGRENDNNGLYYYRARYYSPAVGRFISSDPIGLAGGINTYSYVEGNPVSFADPLGLWRWPDYVMVGIPTVFPGVGVSLTVDRYGNVYPGIAFGASLPGVSGRAWGVGWTGDSCKPSEQKLKDFVGGWSGNAGVGVGVTWSSPSDPGNGASDRLGYNIQTPGVSYGYNQALSGAKLPIHW
ncbi:RHS repeat-associated core domain-containing protein [Collimonas arenae]|uniref:RHS repeat-associated core domain-containing protein n=1 Tax=Collimonas arenae TaxID=279058 RepID=UPI0007784B06|nr:RHS repeat-associated core domain-containing protein [Collimonas arenae]